MNKKHNHNMLLLRRWGAKTLYLFTRLCL
uniref:Uncharacterized protein n=1 Tax=Arundo donax TaxID=35708 RepID=A0A0A8ZZQ9_ARUDO